MRARRSQSNSQLISHRVIKKAIGKHDLLFDHFFNLPEKIIGAKAVYKSKTVSSAFVVLIDDYDLLLKPIVVAIHILPKKGKIVIENIASIYGKEVRQLNKWDMAKLKM